MSEPMSLPPGAPNPSWSGLADLTKYSKYFLLAPLSEHLPFPEVIFLELWRGIYGAVTDRLLHDFFG